MSAQQKPRNDLIEKIPTSFAVTFLLLSGYEIVSRTRSTLNSAVRSHSMALITFYFLILCNNPPVDNVDRVFTRKQRLLTSICRIYV